MNEISPSLSRQILPLKLLLLLLLLPRRSRRRRRLLRTHRAVARGRRRRIRAEALVDVIGPDHAAVALPHDGDDALRDGRPLVVVARAGEGVEGSVALGRECGRVLVVVGGG